MKFCPKCEIEKEDDCFYMRPDRNGKIQSYCKECNKNLVLERQRKLKLQCIEYLGNRCIKCGVEGHPAIYDFHHRNPENKDFNLGHVKTTKFSKKITDELDKCDLLCSNCHRLEHVKY